MIRTVEIRTVTGMDYTVHATAVIEGATPAEVFQRITDIERIPDWNLEVPEVLERPEVLEVGSQWLVRIHAMKTHWNSRSTLVEIDPARRRFAYRSQSDDGNPSQADWCWEVTEDPAGARVDVSVSVIPRTFFRKWLLSELRKSGLEKAVHESLRTLQEQVRVR